jgi:hypothetical protein
MQKGGKYISLMQMHEANAVEKAMGQIQSKTKGGWGKGKGRLVDSIVSKQKKSGAGRG